MIALASGLRVYLACGVTDMRNYAVRWIMWSPVRRGGGRPGAGLLVTQHNFWE